MSSIVKAAAVVDDRHRQAAPVITGLFENRTAVIKRQILSGAAQNPGIPDYLTGIGEQSYTEHINRMRLQMDEAREELRKLNSSLEEARAEVERLKKEQETLEYAQEVGVDVKVRQMLEEAEQQAAALKERVARESESAAQQLRDQGYKEGLEQGEGEALRRFQDGHRQDIEKISALLENLSFAMDEQVRQNESQIISLATAIAEKIVGVSLQEKPQRVVDMLRGVLEENKREAFVKVTISPDLMPVQAKVSQEVLDTLQDMGRQIDVHVETAMDPGSLVVETPKGFTDLSVPTQLENIEKALQETLSEEE